MADVARSAPGNRRRPRKPDDEPPPRDARRTEDQGDEQEKASGPPDDHATRPMAERGDGDGSRQTAAFIARRAAEFVATMSGRRPESVISIERMDRNWRVGVEVVEVPRIPDSADILAVYEVRLNADGDLMSYRRVRRYARGHLDWEHCR